MTWVKICGITTMRAGIAATEAGADAVGFVFWPGSKRLIDPERAQALTSALPGHLAKVGVWVDAPVDEVLRTARTAGLTHLQLHGDEPPEAVAELPLPVLKGIRLKSEDDLPRLLQYRNCWGILVEPHVGGTAGGAGIALDWQLAVAARDALRLAGFKGKFILAGGLAPESIRAAVAAVGPDGVDVSSGVETNGVKDIEKIYSFVTYAKGARP